MSTVKFVACAVSTHPPLFLGEIDAANIEDAKRLSESRFHLRPGETLEVVDAQAFEGPRVSILSRLKELRSDHLDHEIPLGAVVQVDLSGLVWSCHYLDAGGAETSRDRPCKHEVPIGPVGPCLMSLIVVGHTRDCDGTPLYVVSTDPVLWPAEIIRGWEQHQVYRRLARFFESGYGRDSLTDTGHRIHVKRWQNAPARC